MVGSISQPSTCSAPTGSVVLNGLPSTGNWTINPGAIAGSGNTITVSNLIPGTYNFSVTTAAGCISHPSADVNINAAPVAPTAPIAGTITQPSSCGTPTGTVVLNGLPSTGTWTINPGGKTGSGTSTTITSLVPGTYSFNITSNAGCISLPSTDVVIISPPGTPATPRVGVVTQPTSCTSSTGSVELSGLPATGNWTVNPGAATGTGTTTTVTDLIPGTYNFTVSLASGCTSLPSSTVVLNAAPGAPSAPTIGAITQPTCAVITGSVILNNLPSGNWTITPGAITGTGSSTTISNLIPGTYKFSVTSDAGCTSMPSENVVISTPGGVSSGLTSKLSDYNGFNISCFGGSNGSVTINLTGDLAQYRFEWTGPDGFTSSEKDVSGLKAGQYTLSITDLNNCSSIQTFTLTEPKRLSMTIEKSVSLDGRYNINCAGATTGTIDISPVNNAGSVTYLWDDGIWGFSRVNLLAGKYRVILTDSNNCTADSTMTLTEPDSLKLRFDVIKPFCPDQSDGSINLSVTGGDPGPDYNYKWSNKSTDKNLVNISGGLYTVTVTDQNGCSANDSIQVKTTFESCLTIPNAISPNGDLINDVLNIGNSEYYPRMEVTIINNWGQTVWKSEKGYPVPWDGRSNGIKLPIDSYFYIINLHNGSKLIAGSVTIIK